tara:strand:+ start:1959 stop:2330 length:372 start_codon:yes stop_codon:yes gene_type:complete
MNQREKKANRRIKHLLDQSIFNGDISDSMKYFQETAYRFHFLLAFMYEVIKGKEFTQEDAIQVVPVKIASRATRVSELKKAVKAGFLIEERSTKDKRARMYKPSDEMFSDFLNLCDGVFFPKI